MKEIISNISEFIRLKICIFVCAIGMSGFLLFNPLNMSLVFVSLTSFLVAAGAYSLNNIRDVKEDRINRKKINPLVFSDKALPIILICFSIGIFFSFFLSLYSILFSLVGTIISIHYSFFKLKKHFLIKNLYTGFGVSVVFLVGAISVNIEVVWYYFLISFFAVIISMISDLRDYKGDKINFIKTLPVSLGYDVTKNLIFLLIGLFSFLILFFSNLFILLPFVFIMLYFLYKNNPSSAHSFAGYSLVFLVFWLLIGSVNYVYGNV